jgi:ketosteroid isomerase-like protein
MRAAILRRPMSLENVEAIHRAAEAISRGEPDPIHDAIAEAAAGEPVRVMYGEVRDLGERVVATGTMHVGGEDADAATEVETAAIFTFRGDRLVDYRDYGDRSAALEAAGLEEERGNLAVVLRAFREMGGEDFRAWDPEVVIENAEGWVLESVYHGHEGLRRWWDDLAEAFGDFRIVLEDRMELDDERVLTTQRFVGRFRLTDIEFDGRWAALIWIRDGKVVRGQGHLSRRRALRAAGVPVD